MTPECPEWVAGSIDRCNTSVKSFCRGFKLQSFARPFVDLARHLVQMGLAVHRQVGPLGEVLPEQAIGVLVGTALPRTLRIAEVNIDVCRQAKPSVIAGVKEKFSDLPENPGEKTVFLKLRDLRNEW
jgi:hypothetical protein